MSKPTLEVIYSGGDMEMSFGGELIYRGEPISDIDAIRKIRELYFVGLTEAAALWKARYELKEQEEQEQRVE